MPSSEPMGQSTLALDTQADEIATPMIPNKELSAQIWNLVLPYLQKPIPSPLTQPARNDLRNQDLCNAALTCKLFSSICEPLLYLSVVTDDLPLFLRAVGTPSSHRLYNYTRSLWIDYRPPHEPETYVTLMKGGKAVWPWFEAPAPNDEQVAEQCGSEVQDLSSSLEWARDAELVAKVFPRLEILAISPVYDGRDKVWREYYRRYDKLRRALRSECEGRFQSFLAHLPNLQYFCLRCVNGPLTIPTTSWASQRPPVRYSQTVHYSADVDKVFVPYGNKIRWTCDASMETSWSQLNRGFSAASEHAMNARLTALAHYPEQNLERDLLDVELYASTTYEPSYMMSAAEVANYPRAAAAGLEGPMRIDARRRSRAEQRRLASQGQAIMLRHFKETVSPQVNDHFKWLPAEDTPRCGACETGPPADLEKSLEGEGSGREAAGTSTGRERGHR